MTYVSLIQCILYDASGCHQAAGVSNCPVINSMLHMQYPRLFEPFHPFLCYWHVILAANQFVFPFTACFLLLLLGFAWVAYRKAQPAVTPTGNPPLRADAAHEERCRRWRSDNRQRLTLWYARVPGHVQPPPSLVRPLSTLHRPNSPLPVAIPSFASAGVAQSTIDKFHDASYDLDYYLTEEMGRIRCGSMQAGQQAGEGSNASCHEGYVGAVVDTPDSETGNATPSPHDVGNGQKDSSNDYSGCGTPDAALSGSAVDVDSRDDTVGIGRQAMQ